MLRLLPLDEIAENLNGPLAVKIDTQGGRSRFVVSGGKRNSWPGPG